MHIIIMGIFAKEKIFFQQTENELLQKIKFAVLYVIYYIIKIKFSEEIYGKSNDVLRSNRN